MEDNLVYETLSFTLKGVTTLTGCDCPVSEAAGICDLIFVGIVACDPSQDALLQVDKSEDLAIILFLTLQSIIISEFRPIRPRGRGSRSPSINSQSPHEISIHVERWKHLVSNKLVYLEIQKCN